MSIVCESQFAHGEENNVLHCSADGRLSLRILKQENGRVSRTVRILGCYRENGMA